MHADTRKYNDGQAPGDRAICERLAREGQLQRLE